MENIYQTKPKQPAKTIWASNPHLKTLLLVLIFVFLFSGIGLVVFAQWSNSFRQQVYEQTQAGLPKHQTAQIILSDGRLRVDSPKDGDTVGQTFTVSGYAQNWFEGTITIKVFDASGTPLYSGSAIAGDNYSHPAPFQSSVTLTTSPKTADGKIEFDDYSAKDGSLVYQKIVKIKFSNFFVPVSMAGWKIYKNNLYGFEFRYPSDLKYSDEFLVGEGYIYFSSHGGAFPELMLDFPKGQSVRGIALSDISKNNCPATEQDGQPADRILQPYANGLLYISDSCGAGSNNYKFIILKNKNFIRLWFANDSTTSLEYFKNIISTFEFTK